MSAIITHVIHAHTSLKTILDLYLTRKKIQFFFQKIESSSMLDHPVKGQPAASTYVQEKWGCQKRQ